METLQACLGGSRPRLGSTDAGGAQSRVVDRLGYANSPVTVHPVPAVSVKTWSCPRFDDRVRVSGSCALASLGRLALGLVGDNPRVVSQGQGHYFLQRQGLGAFGPKGQRGAEGHHENDKEDSGASQPTHISSVPLLSPYIHFSQEYTISPDRFEREKFLASNLEKIQLQIYQG